MTVRWLTWPAPARTCAAPSFSATYLAGRRQNACRPHGPARLRALEDVEKVLTRIAEASCPTPTDR